LLKEDWQIIKEYPFGTLGYDEEEGLKISTTPAGLSDTVKMIKKMYREHKIPKTMTAEKNFEYNTFQVKATDSTHHADSIELFKSLGLVADPRYKHIYTLA
jgi:hypothetical protein